MEGGGWSEGRGRKWLGRKRAIWGDFRKEGKPRMKSWRDLILSGILLHFVWYSKIGLYVGCLLYLNAPKVKVEENSIWICPYWALSFSPSFVGRKKKS